MEQVMITFKMSKYTDKPCDVPDGMQNATNAEKAIFAERIIISHLKRWGYTGMPNNVEQDGNPDHLFNYASNLCHWALRLMHMNDVAREGDIDRARMTLKANLPFFFSHSPLSKYFVECIDMLLKCTKMSSPQMCLRLLESSFVNIRGGLGNNIETDLVMEHSIRNKKTLIRNLGANKTDLAIHRATNAADTVLELTNKFEDDLNLFPKSRKSGYIKDEQEVRMKIQSEMSKLKPFSKQPGRRIGNLHLSPSPRNATVFEQMRPAISKEIALLTKGKTVFTDEVDSDSDLDSEDDLPEL